MASLPSPAQPLRRFLLRGGSVAAFGVVIAIVLWSLLGQRFATTLTYSLCISLSCWLLIDSGRLALSHWLQGSADRGLGRSQWPGWPWMILVVLAGSLLGYEIGNQLANALTGLDSPGPLDMARHSFAIGPRGLVTVLVLAIVPATLITWFFKSRETFALQQAQLLQAERQASEQQLHMLQAQLEPHMLFNTLANLRALIGVDAERAQAMLDRLIAFLRASLAGSRTGSHALGDEFARVADYLELMQVRMGARLSTSFALPEALAAAQVPAMLLQPIVENSIKHGLEPRREGGRVDVRAERDGDALVIRIHDTGIGLADVAPATPMAGTATTGGFGLIHVRERLATLFGARAAFSLEPVREPGGGTCATVRLPLSYAVSAAARTPPEAAVASRAVAS